VVVLVDEQRFPAVAPRHHMVHRTHYLRLLRTLVKNQGPYLAPAGRTRGAAPEEFAAAAQETWNVMQNKWRTIPGGLDLMLDEAHPLGFCAA